MGASGITATNWLAEFSDPVREDEFLRREVRTQSRGVRIGVALTSLAVAVALWSDLRFLAAEPAPTGWVVGGRLIELAGLALGILSTREWRRASRASVIYAFAALVVALGHYVNSYGLWIDLGVEPRPFWPAFLAFLSLVFCPHALRYAALASAAFVVGGLAFVFAVVPLASRLQVLFTLALFLAWSLGVVLAHRLNRLRRREYAALELERLTASSLDDEMRERIHVEGHLLAENERLEQQLTDARRLEALGRLAAGVAHDLNNLLTPVVGYSELAQLELPEGSPVAPMLDQVKQSAFDAKELVSQLLAVGRKQRLRLRHVELGAFLRQEEASLRAQLRPTQTLRVEVHEEIWVQGDSVQLGQVLLNLVVNARDASPADGLVEVTLGARRPSGEDLALGLRMDDDHACLRVRDHGEGMDELTQRRIFEPFFTTKREGRGTGLGLATVEGVVRQHGGAIKVESVLGEGTCFSVWLPRATAPLSDAADGSDYPLTLRGGTESVLVYEPDAIVATLMERILHRFGYAVSVAGTLEGCRELVGRTPEPFHLLILEESLPAAVLAELQAAARRRRGDVRLLWTSGRVTGGAGAGEEVLAKPFTRSELVGRVRRALDERSGQTALRRA